MDSEEDAPLHGHTQTIQEDGDKRHNEGRTGDGIQRQWSILPRPQTTNCVSLHVEHLPFGRRTLEFIHPLEDSRIRRDIPPYCLSFLSSWPQKYLQMYLSKYVVTEEGKLGWHRD